ncbi:putative exported protein [Kockovaella imperatae]|uniref:Putative exported protein n=1 Tax=Kockovaella imperatae TaxID=4999 RepID=A0A1Y1UME2_9TREE|nr:putative exported protein [Kockovaella imperatae]ORX39179.1 putative exported protein [Kockovaella imperatae]
MSETKQQLTPWHTAPLPLGQIKPHGWLAKELRVFADGLAGNLYDFWPYVNDSKWLHPRGSGKGTDYSALNEPLPYWFNGLVPLAYLLDDDRLKSQVHAVAETVLAYQAEDGWLGPELEDRNFWGRTPLTLGLIQLAEADPYWCKPVVDALRRYYRLMNAMLKDGGKGFLDGSQPQWGQLRVYDTILGIQWLLEHQPSGDDDMLWETMWLLEHLNPLKWEDWYKAKGYPRSLDDPEKELPHDVMSLHGVNVGQGLKAPAVSYRNRANPSRIADIAQAVTLAFGYHGAPSGTMLADEFQRNLAPWMGSELCMHIETAYSMSYAYHTLGINDYADRAELATYNALPAAFTDEYFAHQYMTQPNQPWAKVNKADYEDGKKKLFTTAHSGVATVFGLEPQYPCCTSNLPQGWPKFITSTWGKIGEKGLAHVLLGPTEILTKILSKTVKVVCDTSYPFSGKLRYQITADTDFDLFIRIPGWTVLNKSTLSIKDTALGLAPDASGLQKISIPRGSTVVQLQLVAEIRVVERTHGVSIYYGPLLYALEIKTSLETTLPHRYDDPQGPGQSQIGHPRIKDHFLTNATPWNIAIDPKTIEFHDTYDLQSPVFEQGSKTTYMNVKGCEIEWPLYLDCTPDVPPKDPKRIGRVKEYRLIPYGSAKLHMSEFPRISVE